MKSLHTFKKYSFSTNSQHGFEFQFQSVSSTRFVKLNGKILLYAFKWEGIGSPAENKLIVPLIKMQIADGAIAIYDEIGG